jgi:dihydroorotate dehydrogenase (fumarate)/dihydropyrimidine dehydrogenase (NAD+) subunit PreA
MVDLSVEFAGIKFKNPIMLSSAEPTYSFEGMKKGIDQGIGGLIAKSWCSADYMETAQNRPEQALLDEQHRRVMGKIPKMYTHTSRTRFVKDSLDEWSKVVEQTVRYGREHDAVVIGSVAGTTEESWVEISKRLAETGVEMLELNFGCPHYGSFGLGGPVGGYDDLAVKLIRDIKRTVSIPILIKEPAQLTSTVDSVRKVREAGAAAVTLTNRYSGLVLDFESGKPYIHSTGGCGGPWVKPLTLRTIHLVAKAMDIPVSGSNGASNWKDALEFMMVGATTVQFCTAVMVHGYGLLSRTLKRISDYLTKHGFKSVREIIGIANEHAMAYPEIANMPLIQYQVDYDACTGCGKCRDACFFGAYTWEDSKPHITDGCVGCHFCQSICPEGAIVPIS